MMTDAGDRITIRRPDDWHLHLRDGVLLAAVLPFTAERFARAVVMPNLSPPVTTAEAARAYRRRIIEALPGGAAFEPLMTCYLTDGTDADALERGFRDGVFFAVKLYPAGATTNAEFGVTDIARVYPVLERMEKIGMPLLVHGEVADADVDVFDREAVFLDRVLDPITHAFPELRITLEHLSTREAVEFVRAHQPRMGGTITPHHLMVNRNDMLAGGIRPHLYCLPVVKREAHRKALREAAVSGEPCFFLGTDSAPHAVADKESACGCAGIFNAPVAVACYAQVFAEEGALDRLETFASISGAAFYGLAPNTESITLERTTWTVPQYLPVEGPAERVHLFRGGEPIHWRLMTR